LNRTALSYFPFVGDTVYITGVVDQYNDNYRLVPRGDGDITPVALRYYTPFFNKPTDAHNRGVKVRVIYESSKDNSYIDQLRSAGIPVLSDTTRSDYGLMHMKIVSIDTRDSDTTNDVVLVGSYNFTVYADTLQVNNLTAIRIPIVARQFLAEFNEMWGSTGDTPNPSAAKFGTQKTHNTDNYFPAESIGVWFPPADTAEQAFTRFILSTSTQIHFGINVFTHDGVRDAYRTLHNTGRMVVGLFDYSDWNSSYSESQTMRTWGPPTYVYPYLNGYTFHDKFAIRDLSAVEFGSANWSYNGFTRSDEVVVIIYSRHFADQFFQYLAASTSPRTEEETGRVRSRRGYTHPTGGGWNVWGRGACIS